MLPWEQSWRRTCASPFAPSRRGTIARRAAGDSDRPIIDENEVDVEEECLKILALYQPVASDLRFIVAVVKINNELERIGDLGVNIAERAISLAASTPSRCPGLS